jgi:hypothetical protein
MDIVIEVICPTCGEIVSLSPGAEVMIKKGKKDSRGHYTILGFAGKCGHWFHWGKGNGGLEVLPGLEDDDNLPRDFARE